MFELVAVQVVLFHELDPVAGGEGFLEAPEALDMQGLLGLLLVVDPLDPEGQVQAGLLLAVVLKVQFQPATLVDSLV